MIAYKGKGFGIGVFDNRSGLTISNDNIWYSFDERNYNFHIVPDENAIAIIKNTRENLSEWLRKQLDDMITSFQNDDSISDFSEEKEKEEKYKYKYRNGSFSIDNVQCSWWRSEGNKESTINHKWIEIECNNYTYLLLPCRLWCDETNHVNSNFGQIQFMRYPTEDNQINRVKTNKTRKYKGVEKPVYEFKIMYPSSDEVREFKKHIYKDEKGKEFVHCVYNPQDLDIEKPNEIAEEFIKFIKGELV